MIKIDLYSVKLALISSMIILFCPLFLMAQYKSKIQIKNINLEYRNHMIEIRYDILNLKPKEKLIIEPKIWTKSGRLVPAHSFSGDLGVVSSGTDKKIIWHIKKDNLYFKENLYADLNAIVLRKVNTAKLLFYSVLYPGLGNYIFTRGRAHLLVGAAAYGCLGTAIYFYHKANTTYDQYLNSNVTISEKNTLFNLAKKENNWSVAFSISAVSIWVGQLIWTYFNTRKHKKKYKKLLSNQLTFSYQSYFVPLGRVSQLSLVYKF